MDSHEEKLIDNYITESKVARAVKSKGKILNTLITAAKIKDLHGMPIDEIDEYLSESKRVEHEFTNGGMKIYKIL